MAAYLARRVLYMLFLLLLLSLVAFVIIQLPPGNIVSQEVAQLRQQSIPVTPEVRRALERAYGLDRSLPQQYLGWLVRIVTRGDLGVSFTHNAPVSELITERITLSFVISLSTLIITYLLAVPIGIYSATHPYSVGDYLATVFGFIGLATPNFLLALILMFLTLRLFGWSVGWLFSREYLLEPWSIGKVIDLFKHLPVVLIVVGTAGTAWVIRVLRSSLLDELKRQYVITARSKGLAERHILFKYPVRLALNPIVTEIGSLFPAIISGETLVAIVISIPTIGPLLLSALQAQDMYLAGGIVLILGSFTMAGVLVSDLLLVVVDPRIRFERRGAA